MTKENTQAKSDHKNDDKDDTAVLTSDFAQVDLADTAVTRIDVQATKAGLHAVSPDALAKALAAEGLAQALPDGVGLVDVADALSGRINAYFEDIAGDRAVDRAGLDGLNNGLNATLEQFGINTPDNGPETGFGIGLGMYMDGHGSTDGYDAGDYFIGLAKVAVGVPMAAAGAVFAAGGEAATLGSTDGAAFSAGVGLSIVGGGLAWDGLKDMAGELSDAYDEVTADPEDEAGSDTPETSETLDGGAKKEADDGAGEEEGMTFTYEEVYGEPDPDAEGDDATQGASDDTDDDEEEGMTFTYEEVYGEPDPDADDSGEDGDDSGDDGTDDQMPVSPDSDTSGGLTREEFASRVSEPNYGSSTGAGVMMPAEDDDGADVFVFNGTDYGSSTGAGVMMPQQDGNTLSPTEVAIMLSGPNYGSSTGAGVMTPPTDDGTGPGHLTGVTPQPLGGDGSQFDFG